MNITGKVGIFILLLSIGFISSAFGAERPLVHNQNILAIAPDNFVCAEDVPVTVRAPDESDFQGDMIKVQRLIAGLRMALEMECPQVKEITLTGEIEGREVYHGVVSESSGWVLYENGTKEITEGSHLTKKEYDEKQQKLSDKHDCDHGDNPCVGNCANGQGTLTAYNGIKYSGTFKNCKLNGEGAITYREGTKDIGTYKDNVLSGKGTRFYTDGSKTVGYFSSNSLHGPAIYYDKNNTKGKKVLYESGYLVDEDKKREDAKKYKEEKEERAKKIAKLSPFQQGILAIAEEAGSEIFKAEADLINSSTFLKKKDDERIAAIEKDKRPPSQKPTDHLNFSDRDIAEFKKRIKQQEEQCTSSGRIFTHPIGHYDGICRDRVTVRYIYRY